jgi:hypothetical protein
MVAKMLEKTSALRGAHLTRAAGILIWVGVASLPACDCGGKTGGGGTIPCAVDTDCPAPTTCDEDRGLCVDGDGGLFACNPPSPGCACQDNLPSINCVGPDSDPSVISSCESGLSVCVAGIYDTCTITPDLNCESVSVGSGRFDPTDANSDQVVTGPEGELILDPEEEQVSFGFLWVANTGENTVSKLDIEPGDEIARYASVTGSNNLNHEF